MKKNELELIRGISAPDPKLRVDDLEDQSERTLLYGYTAERDTFHTYLKDGEIHRVIYSFKETVLDYIHGEELDIWLLFPSKRSYPERTDFEFAKEIAIRGGHISFTTFTEGVEESQFYGLVI